MRLFPIQEHGLKEPDNGVTGRSAETLIGAKRSASLNLPVIWIEGGTGLYSGKPV